MAKKNRFEELQGMFSAFAAQNTQDGEEQAQLPPVQTAPKEKAKNKGGRPKGSTSGVEPKAQLTIKIDAALLRSLKALAQATGVSTGVALEDAAAMLLSKTGDEFCQRSAIAAARYNIEK